MKYVLMFPLVILMGCGSLVTSTLFGLNSLNPLTADPEVIAVYFDFPDGVSIQEGSAKLSLEARNTSTHTVLNGEFVLAEDRVQDWVRYRLDAASVAQLRGFQKQVGQWGAENSTGSISIYFIPCAHHPDWDTSGVLSASVSFAIDMEPKPLFKEVPMDRVMARMELDEFPLCDSTETVPPSLN